MFKGVIILHVNFGILNVGHKDRSIHIERACWLHGVKKTQHALQHTGFIISLLSRVDQNIQKIVQN